METLCQPTCEEKHPRTGDKCVKLLVHNLAKADPVVMQHVTNSGLRWPLLHELNPAEGYNGPQSFRN